MLPAFTRHQTTAASYSSCAKSLQQASALPIGYAWELHACKCNFAWVVQPATVTTQSTERGQQLAKRLKDAGAKMYGAFWCSHCHEQKEYFGSQAMRDFPYVECYPNGFHKVHE